MHRLFPIYALLVFCLSSSTNAQVNYTDGGVAPSPALDFNRYLTLWGNGSRTYVCDSSSDDQNYTLADLNYNLYYAQPVLNTSYLVGRRVFLAKPDYASGTFSFYTKVGAMTYWVGKVLKNAPDPSQTSDLDLPAELELVTERSEPKPGQTDVDLGTAEFTTRFGAVGGLLPSGTVCSPSTETVIVKGTTYYSFWTRVAAGKRRARARWSLE